MRKLTEKQRADILARNRKLRTQCEVCGKPPKEVEIIGVHCIVVCCGIREYWHPKLPTRQDEAIFRQAAFWWGRVGMQYFPHLGDRFSKDPPSEIETAYTAGYKAALRRMKGKGLR